MIDPLDQEPVSREAARNWARATHLSRLVGLTILPMMATTPTTGQEKPATATIGQTTPAMPAAPGQVQIVIGADGKLQYVFKPANTVPPAKHRGNEIALAELSGVTDYYRVQNEDGKVVSVVGVSDDPSGRAVLADVTKPGWQVTNVTIPDESTPDENTPDFWKPTTVPIPREVFLKDLGANLLDSAKQLACNTSVVPDQITVSASITAGFSLFVSGEGAVEFQATWATSKICDRRDQDAGVAR